MAKQEKKSKGKQQELPGMPEGPHRDLLLGRVELAEKIGSMGDELKIMDDSIRTAMRQEKAKAWSVENEEGKKFHFTLKTTGERVVMTKVKEKKSAEGF